MKKLDILINNCRECPFCRYEVGYDAGYYCYNSDVPNVITTTNIHIAKQIISEKDLMAYDLEKKNNKEITDPMKDIPDWCPLDDV